MVRTARFALAGLSIGIVCLFIVISATAGGAADLSPIGVWATEGATSHVKIDECGGKLCGAIVWLKEPLNKEGKDKVDSENPDPGRIVLGVKFLSAEDYAAFGRDRCLPGFCYAADMKPATPRARACGRAGNLTIGCRVG